MVDFHHLKYFVPLSRAVWPSHSFVSHPNNPNAGKSPSVGHSVHSALDTYNEAKMSFTFGNTGASSFGSSGFASLSANSSNPQIQTGPELEEIQTEALGFHALAGESKVQLLPSAWPTDALPPPTSSLLAVASNRGLLAAGGPSSVVVASTESVRQAFNGDGGDIKQFTPQLTLELGTRISQVAFSSDESVLVLSAEQGGGLAIYSVENLMQGNKQSAFEMPTNGVSVRSLIPNPAMEHAELFAVVTTQGQLMMANMKERHFANGTNGPVLKEGVSSVSWSNKGKQLIAGLGDGTSSQMKPDGQIQKEIPRPPGLEGEQHGKCRLCCGCRCTDVTVSALSWLENDLFVVAHTPSNGDGSEMPPVTAYHLVTREKDSPNCLFQKLPEVCSPFGLNRSPPFQFIQRLKEFPPDLKDMVVLASTASSDVGIFTRSTKTLASDSDPSRLTNVFTATSPSDSRRAQLPMEDMASDTSPIGMVFDLSGKTNVHRPLPGEEIDESQGPLPALMILNHVGVLSAWWVAYAESIRNGTHYPGLSVYASQQQPQAKLQPQVQAPAPAFGRSTFGQSSFGSTVPPSTFGTPNKPPAQTFGSTSSLGAAKPGFGSTSALGGGASTFGSTSTLGSRPSPFGSSTPQQAGGGSFGQPAFGSASGLGQKSSPWASSSTTGSAFGQTSSLGGQGSTFGGQTQQSTFGSGSSLGAGSGGGFASFANSGGFAAAAAKSGGTGSFLQQQTPSKEFGSEMDTGSAFTPTPKKDEKLAGGVFGLGSSGFQLKSAWKNESAGEDTSLNPAPQQTKSLFGGDFGKALGDTSTEPSAPQSNEADMSDISDEGQPKEANRDDSLDSPQQPLRATTTPVDTPAPAKFSAPMSGGLFGTKTQSATTPAAEVQKSIPTQSIFGGPGVPTAATQSTPIIKKEPVDEDQFSRTTSTPGQPPLPPDATSKTTYTPGTSSANSSASTSKQSAEEAPLPPDFSKPTSKAKAAPSSDREPPAAEDAAPLPPDFIEPKSKAQLPQTPTDAPPSFMAAKPQSEETQDSSGEATALPDDNDSLDDEGSGVDVAKEISREPSPKITPESSFGGKQDAGGPFAKVTQPQPQPAQKSLFGEVGKANIPVFPPPSKLQESPRSPSPVRSSVPIDLLRPENQRSVSAPERPGSKAGTRRAAIQVQQPERSFVERQREEQERVTRERERQRREEDQPLSDDEDECMRKQLAAPIVPTLEIDSFLAHKDYVGDVSKPGIAGQIEKLYRDINSMIDVLGLNSRNLQAFTSGHSEFFKQSGRDKDDLSPDSDEWTLVEIDHLVALQNSLFHKLGEGSLRDVDDKTRFCSSLAKDLAKLRGRKNDLKRTIDSRSNPDSLEIQRLAPLSIEQSTQRQDLRRDFATFQTTLAKAEEAISDLRARLATLSSSSPSKHKSPQKVPTVEAVESTIRRMTAMAERKSGDIDVLESQMRRLGISLGGRPGSAGSPSLLGHSIGGPRESPHSSCSSSPVAFITPPTSARKSLRSSFINGTGNPTSTARSNAFCTPRSSRLGDSMASSYAATSPSKSPRRKKLSDISKEEAREYGERMARKKEVKAKIREALLQRGEVKVRELGRD